jgi:hypothetical protein
MLVFWRVTVLYGVIASVGVVYCSSYRAQCCAVLTAITLLCVCSANSVLYHYYLLSHAQPQLLEPGAYIVGPNGEVSKDESAAE